MHGADINKYINSERTTTIDSRGNFAELEPWDEEKVDIRARELGIEMNDFHWEVLVYLREHFLIHGQVKSARLLVEELGRAFADEGGRRFLYQLFPGGPVTQGCYLAGVPLPPHASDPSFGSVE